MNKIEFSSCFSKSLSALLLQYTNAPITLNAASMKEFLCEFIENGEYIDTNIRSNYKLLSTWSLWKNSFPEGYPFIQNSYSSQKAEYLLSIFMLLFIFKKNLAQKDFYNIDNLYEMQIISSSANIFISSLIMDYDFEDHGSLDFTCKYIPNLMVSEYIGNIYKSEVKQKFFEDTISDMDISFNDNLIDLCQQLDKEIITTGIAFMQIQTILLLMESSSFYPRHIRKISKDILLLFKDLLANSRIQKIEIDSAISAGVLRKGIRKTTGIKIFFALENNDCYCLRIDFPHDGEEFLHYNLNDPGCETALPLNVYQYNELIKKYSAVDSLFFHMDNLYWFRNNFIQKLENMSPSKDSNDYEKYLIFYNEMLKLFQKQSHYKMFAHDISKENMIDFIVEFGSALSYMSVSSTSFSDTEVENISLELQKLKLRDILFDSLMFYRYWITKEQFFNHSYDELKQELKSRLLDVLFTKFNSSFSSLGSYEDYNALELMDLLMLIYEEIKILN